MQRNVVLLAILMSACTPEYVIGEDKEPDVEVGARIEVTPQLLEFEAASAGEPDLDTFSIRNVGNANLEITDVVFVQTPGSFTMLNDGTGTLEPGQETTVDVQYAPLAPVESGLVVVGSDDSSNSEVLVELLGRQLPGTLVINPNPYDFGYADINGRREGAVTLKNVGIGPVEVTRVYAEGDEFTVSNVEDFPRLIAAGASSPVIVEFSPDEPGEVFGKVFADNNSELPVVNGDLIGYGSEAPAPVAVCSVAPDTIEPLVESAVFVGGASYDPQGQDIVDYTWTLVSQPAGSIAQMNQGSSPNRTFVADLAGQYTGELVVTNASGLSSDPCYATLEVVPTQDLWIEMFWVHSGDDMDLHLLRPGANTGQVNTSADCHWANCTWAGLDWGLAGVDADDPILDLDDIPGTGPENINIRSPQNGRFTVVLHDYPGSVYSAANDVTINIYIGGVLEWSDTRTITGESSYTPYAAIDWQDTTGTVTSL